MIFLQFYALFHSNKFTFDLTQLLFHQYLYILHRKCRWLVADKNSFSIFFKSLRDQTYFSYSYSLSFDSHCLSIIICNNFILKSRIIKLNSSYNIQKTKLSNSKLSGLLVGSLETIDRFFF